MDMRQASPAFSRGFTLLEVLIALVVAVIGVLGIIQLSGVVLNTISDSERRAIAMTLAEDAIENLRGFERLEATSASAETAFTDIVNTAPATVTVSTGTSSLSYDVSWDVVDYFVSGGAVTAFTSGAVNKRFKEVAVTVSWDTPTAGSVSLSSIIAAISDSSAVLANVGAANIGGGTPDVEYTPGEAPDVIAVDVGDGKFKETTKPLPEVEAKNESTVVRIETITYDTSEIQLVQEDYVTVNCFCEMSAGSALIRTPAYRTFENETEGFEEHYGDYVSAATGTALSLSGGRTQSEYCDRCCAGHHDSVNNTTGITFKTGASSASGAFGTLGDHAHYTYTISGDEVILGDIADSAGDDYVEACRFKRIDGIYRLVPDWKAFEVNVFPESYLTSGASSSLASYVTYIKDRVHYELRDTVASLSVWSAVSAPTISPTPEITTATGDSTQALSRTLYLDDISHDTALLTYLSGLSAASVSGQAWLQYIPFNEVNTTLLSTWQSASESIASVTSEVIDLVDDPVTDYYGSFSRGLVVGETATAASTSVTAYMRTDNTGLLGNEYANPSAYKGSDNKIVPSPGVVSGSLAVNVNICGLTCYISGVIEKDYSGNNPMNFSSIDFGFDASADVYLTVSPSGFGCSYGLNTGTQISFSCEVPNVGTYDLTVAGSAFVVGDGDGITSNGVYNSQAPGSTGLTFTLERP
ncbi:type IV pilus modification PilV family protein [Pontibacter sp. JAM-7]|uniref:type IV pilus modification PilV family protein n=1 Tax=Pontibacter sp. JAM-7 TaxID=3366581 RepID=UPI003AF7B0F5